MRDPENLSVSTPLFNVKNKVKNRHYYDTKETYEKNNEMKDDVDYNPNEKKKIKVENEVNMRTFDSSDGMKKENKGTKKSNRMVVNAYD